MFFVFISCKHKSKYKADVLLETRTKTELKPEKIEIAKRYYKTLNNFDDYPISDWFADSLKTIEGEHVQTYSQKEYTEFLKWDAVFEPTYQILKIEDNNDFISARIVKTDKRISFLHEAPFITNQILKFHDNKIISVEIEYIDFDEATWAINKDNLLNWINKSHPKLNGFLNDQTENGGIKFLKAIELYENRN